MLATLDDVRDAIAQFAGCQTAPGSIATGAWGIYSHWQVKKVPGGTGAAPSTTGANPTSSTAGAIAFRNAGAGNELRLCGLDLWVPPTGVLEGILHLHDRLWACGGLSGTSTSLNTFTSAITRGDTTGEGCELYLEIYTTIGNTGSTFTISYTNQAGTSGRTATVTNLSSNRTSRQVYPVSLQAGDTGVRSVESVQLSASTGTAGSYGLSIVRPLVVFPFRQAKDDRGQFVMDPLGLGFPAIEDDACLAYFSIVPEAVSSTIAQLGLTLELREG